MVALRTELAGVAVLTFCVGIAPAQVVGFENFAPSGGLTNINPTMPYVEAGFQFLPSNGSSAVFDSAASTTMPGNTTDWFGFAGGNVITLSRLSGPPFSLTSVLAGPSSIAQGNPITMTLVGSVFGGGTLNATFPDLTTATLETLNWTNLASVTFSTSLDAGIDNINLTPVPEPASLILVGAGLLAGWRWRRNVN